MAQPQNNASLTAPGFAGLNTQDSPLAMDITFASVANNCVIDNLGRIASRRGFVNLTDNPVILGTSPIIAMAEYINGVDGSTVLFCAGNNIIFKQDLGGTLVAMTVEVGHPGITDDNWQMVNFNDKMYFVQEGHQPLLYDPVVSTTELQLWAEEPPNVGVDGYPNVAHAAFGRLWCADFDNNSTVVAWSSILDGEDWTDGGSGTLQTAEYWPSGFDEVTAIAAHNNFLVVYGKNNILLYQTTADVLNSINLVDTIEGIGCIARDSVVPTGQDFMFIDSTGVRSLNRTIQEKSVPIGDISRNVRDEFQFSLEQEIDDEIKGVFHHEDSFYCCFLPQNPKTYVFDTWQPLQGGAARATIWNNIKPRCGVRTRDRVTYFGGAGGVYTYTGAQDIFLDPDNAFAVTQQEIPMEYYTHPLDFGSPANLIFPKQVDVTVFGGVGGDLGLNWAYDYQDPRFRKVKPIVGVATGSEWNDVIEWSDPEGQPGFVGVTGEWTGSSETLNRLKYNIWGSGCNIKIGFDSKILGSPVSIQEINIQVLQGRIL